LDADEWLDPAGRAGLAALRAGLERGGDDAVYFMRQVSPLGAPGAGALVVAQPRLFRIRPGVRWAYRVHEQVIGSCLALGARAVATEVERSEERRVGKERGRWLA